MIMIMMMINLTIINHYIIKNRTLPADSSAAFTFLALAAAVAFFERGIIT